MARNKMRIESASNVISHILMGTKIMDIAPEVPAVPVECGSFETK